MPAKTGKQFRAMAAAMSGRSSLGIPADVGREFVKETPKKKRKSFAEEYKKGK